MLTDSIIALLISFVVCAALCPVLIPVLHRMKFGQQVRDDGPQAHLKKQGTPTMGGIMIVIAVIAGTLPFVVKHPLVRPVLIFTVVYGFIGFLDDYLKIRKKQSEGLSVKQKLVMQLIATGLLAVWLYRHPQANFTDGLDGLCSSVTVAFSLFFLAAAVKEGIPAAPVAGAVIGALLGFLLFNCYPAKVFMGDTGSLALGGYAASLALVMQMPLFIVIVGFIYLAEVLSVMIQVGYFKKTHGKRIFRMAPIHHHFELGGWSETRVVTVFTTVTVILSLIAWLGLQ